ncbi:Hypothetical protein NTJ_03384 [Nesidiocoris tenuis]|uniref:Uncharacterized protein n=1 Tax=Nesidiocoris tenuis TaxID=355587 RepID=A0ABN7AE61_9HEMI|nr:Hypothetical protein NTJ_03384 [Nesidiocoris tenuis]
MKVSLLFLALAVYGAVAEDEVHSSEEVVQSHEEQEESSTTDEVNSKLDDILSTTDVILDAKLDVVGKIGNLIDELVESATNNAVEVTENVAAKEKDLIAVINADAQILAAKIKERNDQAAVLAGRIFGSKAAEFLKDLNNKQLEAQEGFLAWGKQIGDNFVDKKVEITKNVANGIKEASKKAKNTAYEKQQKLTQLEKNLASTIFGGLKEKNGRIFG